LFGVEVGPMGDSTTRLGRPRKNSTDGTVGLAVDIQQVGLGHRGAEQEQPQGQRRADP
jgi:hypothetical protein